MKIELLKQLEQKLSEAKTGKRFILGICGAPASGKSTLAAWLVDRFNKTQPGEAVLVPMDGFHFSNEKLEKMNLLALKGIPETFDSEAFVAKMESIKNQPELEHLLPRFDRSIEASIENDIRVSGLHKLIVVEGNYLLLASPPWNRLKKILDEIWYLDADEELIFSRLVKRHLEGGKSKNAALEKVRSTDLPNALLISKNASEADRVIKSREL